MPEPFLDSLCLHCWKLKFRSIFHVAIAALYIQPSALGSIQNCLKCRQFWMAPSGHFIESQDILLRVSHIPDAIAQSSHHLEKRVHSEFPTV